MLNLNPFVELFVTIIRLYSFALLVWIILSWLISFEIVNRNQPFVRKLNEVLSKVIEPLLRPIRRVIPDIGGIDFSPIVLILGLQFLQSILWNYFYTPAAIIPA